MGVRVQMQSNEVRDFPDATSATITPDGRLVVVRTRKRGFPEAVAEFPREEWWSWEPWTKPASPGD